MRPKPACFGEKYASAFGDHSVVNAYQHRPTYSAAVFPFLANLIIDTPRHALDVGCGTGAIARYLVELVDHVDAVDGSPAMIDQGQRLANGDHAYLTWIVGRVEEVALAPPYALITAGDSLHWFDWEVVLPRFAQMLTPDGYLVILQMGQLPVLWDAGLDPLIQQYSTNQDYRSVDLITELEQRGLFRKHGELRTEPVPFKQSLDAYIESFHGRASFSRERMTTASATAFDAAVRNLVAELGQDAVELQIVTDIIWGKPLQP
jgi:ubiquinone/menaquinone biosynthesis C-methylase UbiE